MNRFKMAMIQMRSVLGDVQKNIASAEAKIREAHAGGAVFICIPEAFGGGFYCWGVSKMTDYAEPIGGATVRHFQALAAELGVYLVVPIIEDCGDGTFRNTAVLIDDAGQTVGKYSKTHLTEGEKPWLTPGNEYNVFDTKYGKIGLLICYDICFPEAARILALKGAEVIVCAMAWRNISFFRDWLINAAVGRALDNVLFMACSAMCGRDLPDSPFTGTSMFVGPTGNVMAKAGIDEETILYQYIDPDILPKERKENTCLIDRRPEDYTLLCERAK